MKWLRCMMLLGHNWKIIRVNRFEDVSFGNPGTLMSRVHKKCRRCGRAKSNLKDGLWYVDDFN